MMPFQLGVPISLGWGGMVSPTGVQPAFYEDDNGFELGRPIALGQVPEVYEQTPPGWSPQSPSGQWEYMTRDRRYWLQTPPAEMRPTTAPYAFSPTIITPEDVERFRQPQSPPYAPVRTPPTYSQQVRSWTQEPQSPIVTQEDILRQQEYMTQERRGDWMLKPSYSYPMLSPSQASQEIYRQMQAHPSKLRPRRTTPTPGRPMGFMMPTLPAGGGPAIPFTGV